MATRECRPSAQTLEQQTDTLPLPVRERTALKLEHARKSGRKFGRPAKFTADQAALAGRIAGNGETATTICKTLGIGRTKLYRYLAEGGEE